MQRLVDGVPLDPQLACDVLDREPAEPAEDRHLALPRRQAVDERVRVQLRLDSGVDVLARPVSIELERHLLHRPPLVEPLHRPLDHHCTTTRKGTR